MGATPSRPSASLLPVLAALVLVLGTVAFLLFRGAAIDERPRNVLLITLDTVRADRLGTYGYAAAEAPHLDALAARGVRFDDAVAPSPITGPSHAAMFTGLYPGRLGVRDNATTPLPDDAVTVAALLAERGFATGGFIGAFILDRPYGFASGFEHFGSGFERVESGRETNAERRGDLVVDDALAWLGSLPAGRPFFGWVHLYDAHAEYAAPEPFGSRFRDNPYDGEIAFVDAQVGRLLDALRARNVLDDTLVIAIADHGEALGDHGEDEHGVFLYEEVIRIPWIAAGPGVRRGHVVAEQVRAIDLMPTVLDALGLDVPGGRAQPGEPARAAGRDAGGLAAEAVRRGRPMRGTCWPSAINRPGRTWRSGNWRRCRAGRPTRSATTGRRWIWSRASGSPAKRCDGSGGRAEG